VRRLSFVLALLAGAITLSACGFKAEPTGHRVLPVYPVTVADGHNRRVVVAHLPRRVVTLAPASTPLLRRIGIRPASQLSPNASPRAVAALRPDLVVLPGTTPNGRAERLARMARAPVFIMGAARLGAIEHALAQLGLAAGEGPQALAVARGLRARRDAVRRRVHAVPRVRVFADVGLGFTPPRDSLLATLIEEAGGRLVGAGAGPVSPAGVGELDPDVYLTTRESGVTLDSLRSRPGTRKLRAVRDGRVVVVDQHQLVAGPPAYTLLRELAAQLHPDAFR
jgi:ABC-type Fe3+-hydroxamate transport system substrate-binding protein